jgi:hypothetical protein
MGPFLKRLPGGGAGVGIQKVTKGVPLLSSMRMDSVLCFSCAILFLGLVLSFQV